MTAILIGISIALRAAATWVALRIASRENRVPWSLGAFALALMTIRQCFSLYDALMFDTYRPFETEAITLGAYALVLIALVGVERSRRPRDEGAAGTGKATVAESYLSRFAIGLGILTIACTAATAYFAYTTSRDLMQESALGHVTSLARSYSAFAEMHVASTRGSSAIDDLKSAWEGSETNFEGSYLRIVDGSGVLRLDTSDSASVGNFLGDAPIAPQTPGVPATYSDLLLSKGSWAGRFIGPDGVDQLAAMSYVPRLESIISVHVPMKAVLADVYSQSIPWIVEIASLALVLFPVCILLHRRAYLDSSNKATDALAEVQKSKLDLHLSEERLQILADVVPVGIFRCTQEGQLVDFNHALTEIVGREREELFRTRWPDFEHPDDRARLLQATIDWLAVGGASDRTFEGEFRVVRPDGEVRSVMVQSRWMESNPSHFVGSMIDVTAQRDTELALAKSREHNQESKKLQAIGELAAGVAHDFGNMLAVIRIAAENLEVTGRSVAVEQIHKATVEAERVVGLLRTFGGGHEVRHFKVVSIADIADEAMGLLGFLVSVDIEIKLDLPPVEQYFVKADPTQLIQVLINLCLNARDAMPDGGKLCVAVKSRTVETNVQGEKSYATIEVSDTGMGMAPQVRDRIFEPYFSTKAERGTGLGMSIVHGIVKEHGGWLEVQSAPGMGTSVIVWLPLASEPESDRRAAPTDLGFIYESVDFENVAILGERDEQVRALLRSSLVQLGFNVVEVSDFADLSNTLASNTGEALVVVDSNLDGHERPAAFLQLLRIVASNSSVVILVEPDHAEQCLMTTRATLLQKPFTVPEFAKIVMESVVKGTDS